MDYLFNPITVHKQVNNNRNISFKRTHGTVAVTPDNTYENRDHYNDSGSLKLLQQSIKQAWISLSEIIPLIDPYKSYKVLENEKHYDRMSKDTNSKRIDYAA